MKSGYFLLLLVLLVSAAHAQNRVNGRVVDETGEPMSYTTVVLMTPQDSTMKYFAVSKPDGTYAIKGIRDGAYLMQFSFTGMETVYNPITIPLDDEQLGDQVMKPSTLDEVIVEAELVPITFKTDTLEFNAKAFQTRHGASVEELLEKLPGVEVDEEGNIQAQGEDVTKVLVDGKEFFGNDPKVATKNLDAEALDKVQVFDRKSEETVFSGIDDGTRDRTINLVLDENHKKGYFGRVSAGMGTSETYKADGRLYRFSENSQIALLGMANNINQFGFTNRGNADFGSRVRGLNQSAAGGINLLYNKDQMNRYFISYLGNYNNKDLNQITTTENIVPRGRYLQQSTLEENEQTQPNRINFGFRHNFSTSNRLILDGDLTIEDGDIFGDTYTVSGLVDNLVNQNQNTTQNLEDNFNGSLDATHISKFSNSSTQLKTSFSGSIDRSTDNLDWLNITTVSTSPDTILLDQYRKNEVSSSSWRVTPILVQKLSAAWNLNVGAGMGQNNNSLDRREGITNINSELEEFAIPTFETQESFIRPTFSLQYNKGTTNVEFALNSLHNQFDKTLTDSTGIPQVASEKYHFFLPSIRYRNEYRSGRRLEFRYGTSAIMPNTNQLFPVPNALNVLSIYVGNIDLMPEKRHTGRIVWSIFDEFSFTSLFISLNGAYTKDKISTSQQVNPDLIQVYQPVNIPEAYVLNSRVDFSTPLRSLGTKINITWTERYDQNMVITNGEDNIQNQWNHALDLSFENRSKTKLGYRIGGRVSYNNSTFSLDDRQNKFWNTKYYATLRYTPSRKLYFEARGDVTNYDAQDFGESVSIPLITAEATYSFMKTEKAAISLIAFDLLNKNVGFQRVSNTNFIMQSEWNTLSRYAMLTFRYNFR